MAQLTYSEIEQLQYILNTYMFEFGSRTADLVSLRNKLITMRAELEYTHNNIELTEYYSYNDVYKLFSDILSKEQINKLVIDVLSKDINCKNLSGGWRGGVWGLCFFK